MFKPNSFKQLNRQQRPRALNKGRIDLQTLSVVQAEQCQTAKYTAQATGIAQGRVDLQTLSVVQAEQLQTAEYTAQATCLAQGE